MQFHSQSDIEIGVCPSQVLWEVEREELGEPQKKQSFVDLGCGNGLLVYLLASEGVSGRGGRGKEGGRGRGRDGEGREGGRRKGEGREGEGEGEGWGRTEGEGRDGEGGRGRGGRGEGGRGRESR